ncbi:MAG TPA: AsmA family protein [Burkholderiales bacterium]|nr:AsmA family protein [Burkholderiales bacterium]
MKALKWMLGITGGVLVVLIVVVAIVAATFDPNQYKPQIVDLVKQKTGRTLAMDGKIGLSFFPRIGAEVEKVALSGPKGQGSFAKVEEARVAVALLPLLSKQVIVDKVVLSGLAVDLVRYKDGRTNFDDLIGAEAKPDEKPGQKPAPAAGPPLAIDVGGIALKNAAIGWRDERDGTDVRLSAVDLETGRIASGVPGKLKLAAKVDGKQPQVRMQVDLATGYVLDFAGGAVALSAFDLKAAGDAPGVTGLDARAKGEKLDLNPAAKRFDLSGIELAAKSKDGLDARFSIPKLALAPDRAESRAISGAVKLAKPGQAVDAKLALSALEAKGKQIQFARFDIDLDAKTGELSVQGKLATPVTLNLEASQVALPGIAGDVAVSGPDIPNKTLRAAVKGGARADWAKQNANAEFAAKLDESNIQAKVAVAHWSKPAINFDVVADRLNVDRYLPPRPAVKPPAGGAPAPAGGSGAGVEKPIDLTPLKALDATGSVKIGALQVQNIKADNVNLGLKAAGGRLDVSPISASLYQGTLAGTAAVNANSNNFAAKQQLTGVSVGPLLRDAANKDILEGRGNVALDVTTAGQTPTALKKALNGTASVALKDGSLKGVDIAGLLRQARAILGSRSAVEQQAKGGQKTDFTELTGSFVIKNGVAHNEDLQAKSPLVRVAGAGDINIGEGSMDYTAKASLVATSTGQGGKDAADVRGITAPVKITGPFDNLKYTVDVAALATDAAKDALARELERRLGGGQAGKAGTSGEKPSGSTRDLLRGILGR